MDSESIFLANTNGTVYIDEHFDINGLERQIDRIKSMYESNLSFAQKEYDALEKQCDNTEDIHQRMILEHQLYAQRKHLKEIEHRIETGIFNIGLDFSVLDDSVLDVYNKVIDRLKELNCNLKGSRLEVVPKHDYVYLPEEIEFLVNLNNKHNENSDSKEDLYFVGEMNHDSYGKGFTLTEVINANNKVDEVVERIKDLSDFEKISYVYAYLTQKMYNGVDDRRNSTTLVGVLNSNKIICVGYVKLLTTILKKAGVNCFVCNENNNHETCFLKVKDDKYGIDGFYYFDPTWDSVNNNITKLNYFALTLDELVKTKEFKINNYLALAWRNNSYGFVDKETEFFFEDEADREYLRKEKQAIDRVFDKYKLNGFEICDSNMYQIMREKLKTECGNEITEENKEIYIKTLSIFMPLILEEKGLSQKEIDLFDFEDMFNLLRDKEQRSKFSNFELEFDLFRVAREYKLNEFINSKVDVNKVLNSKPIDSAVIKEAMMIGTKKLLADMQNDYENASTLKKRFMVKDIRQQTFNIGNMDTMIRMREDNQKSADVVNDKKRIVNNSIYLK